MIKKQDSFIVLYSQDIPRTVAFFRMLNASIMEETDTKCVVNLGGFELHYVVSEPMAPYQFIRNTATSSKGLILYVAVDDISFYRSKITKSEGHILSEIVETPWNTKEFLFNDPDGYHFVLYKEE